MNAYGWNPSSLIYHYVTERRDIRGRVIAVCKMTVQKVTSEGNKGRRECQRCHEARGLSLKEGN